MDKIKDIEQTIAELDFIYQDGVIFNTADVKTLRLLSEQLNGIVKDLIENKFNQVR